jgi:hypothetical protein
MEPKTISTTALKRLLYELKDKGPGVCIRLRMMGEMWHQNFTRIVLVTDSKILLFDEILNRTLLIGDVNRIIQFEIDNRFQTFQPFFHYDVQPMKEIEYK